MNNLVQTLEPTWTIQDATKLQEYMSCPRSYFFNYVLGWRQEEPNVHLIFGEATHKAMEVLLKHSRETGEPACEGYTVDAVMEAQVAFEKVYRKSFSPDTDDLRQPKNQHCFNRMLNMYVQQYRHLDDFKVRFIEVAGAVELDDKYTLHYRSDAICESPDGEIFSLEHKTASNFNRQWTDQWTQKMQIGVYSHVLYCYFDPSIVFGVKINGMIPHAGPKLKNDGTPYANAGDCAFIRVPIRKTTNQMEDWYYTARHWLVELNKDFELLYEAHEEDYVLDCFHKNTESCTKYFGCPFKDFCNSWNNPLQHLDRLPVGFKVEHWNPLSLVSESATKIDISSPGD